MIVIVSNKQKSALDNANIDAIKDLNGLFNVQDLINNFKNYFFTRMVIDATSIVDFTNPEVLKQLANGIGSEKLVVLLPPKPEPPLKFLETLVNIGIYNFSTNIEELVKLIESPLDYDSVNRKIHGGLANGNMPKNNANNASKGNNNPDMMMRNGGNIVPQSARNKDIVSLDDFVSGGIAPPSGNSPEPVNNMEQNNVPVAGDLNVVSSFDVPVNEKATESNPFDNINAVTPVASNPGPVEKKEEMASNLNDFSNGNSFLNTSQQSSFIGGFDEPKAIVVGFRNITEHAGTTTLLYKMKETIESRDRKRVALVEIGTNDFMFFRINDATTVAENELDNCLNSIVSKFDYIFVDLNNTTNDSICDFVLYLIEPSKIKVNKLAVQNRNIFNELKGKYVVLNKSMLSDNEKGIFSQEANLPFYASVAPFNDRVDTTAIDELISKIDDEKNNKMANNQTVNQSHGFIGF
jgi:hypothetical protein